MTFETVSIHPIEQAAEYDAEADRVSSYADLVIGADSATQDLVMLSAGVPSYRVSMRDGQRLVFRVEGWTEIAPDMGIAEFDAVADARDAGLATILHALAGRLRLQAVKARQLASELAEEAA